MAFIKNHIKTNAPSGFFTFCTHQPINFETKSPKEPWFSCHDFLKLIEREWNFAMRKNDAFIVRALQTLISSLFFAFVFIQLPESGPYAIWNRGGFLSFVSSYWLTVIISTFPTDFPERLIQVKRERYDHYYAVSTFLLAVLSVEVAILLSQVIVFSFIVFYIPSLSNSDFVSFLLFVSSLCTQLISNCCLGMLVSSVSSYYSVINMLRGLVIFLCILFGGYLASPKSITWILRWMIYLDPVYYVYRNLLQRELDFNTFDGVSGRKIFSQRSLDQFGYVSSYAMLMSTALMFFLISWFIVSYRTRPTSYVN